MAVNDHPQSGWLFVSAKVEGVRDIDFKFSANIDQLL